jgi:hypothetical protein
MLILLPSNPIKKVGVFITREEYANLFHAIRDLFNTFQALVMSGIIAKDASNAGIDDKIQVVWLDGHAKVLCVFALMLFFRFAFIIRFPENHLHVIHTNFIWILGLL